MTDHLRGAGQVPTTLDISSSCRTELQLHYPLVEQLFATGGVLDMRARLARTLEDLERVVRRGPPEDVQAASKAILAYNLTIEVLDELQRSGPEVSEK